MTLHTDTIPNSHCLVPLGASLGQFIFNLMTFKKKKNYAKISLLPSQNRKVQSIQFLRKKSVQSVHFGHPVERKKMRFFPLTILMMIEISNFVEL